MFNGKIHYKWSFSIAMLNYQRVFSWFPTQINDVVLARLEMRVLDVLAQCEREKHNVGSWMLTCPSLVNVATCQFNHLSERIITEWSWTPVGELGCSKGHRCFQHRSGQGAVWVWNQEDRKQHELWGPTTLNPREIHNSHPSLRATGAWLSVRLYCSKSHCCTLLLLNQLFV